MSWRLSWYKAPKGMDIIKTDVTEYHDGTVEEYTHLDTESMDKVFWSTGTDIWFDIRNEYKNNHEYFINLLDSDDIDNYECTKKGLRLFIEHYRKRVYDYMTKMLQPNNDLPNYCNTPAQYLEQKSRDWTEYDINSVLDDKNPYELTKSWYYEYSIFNLISLYKQFDFENYRLILHGG